MKKLLHLFSLRRTSVHTLLKNVRMGSKFHFPSPCLLKLKQMESSRSARHDDITEVVFMIETGAYHSPHNGFKYPHVLISSTV